MLSLEKPEMPTHFCQWVDLLASKASEETILAQLVALAILAEHGENDGTRAAAQHAVEVLKKELASRYAADRRDEQRQ
jgi:hypothetical protein